jgi:hypothetical protein
MVAMALNGDGPIGSLVAVRMVGAMRASASASQVESTEALG